MSKAMLYFLCLKSAFKIRNALNEKLHNSSRAGTLLDRILYFGPIFRKIEDEIVKNYEVKLKIIYDYYKNV